MRRDNPDAVELDAPAGAPWPSGWTPAGVIEALEPLVGTERLSRIGEVLANRLSSVAVFLDEPHDPHNVSAVLRSCDAFAVQHLHFASSEGLLVSQRVSQGTDRWVDMTQHSSSMKAVSALKAEGFVLVAAHPKGRLVPEDLSALPRVAIVLGNEHRGIAPEVLEHCDHTVRIPMRGFVESLNLSVSAAVLLHAATRSRPGDLPAAEHQTLYARGLWHSVIRAADVLAASTPR